MFFSEPSYFVPYTKRDVENFFSDRVKVLGFKVEPERTGGFWVDMHFLGNSRRFVAQFIYISPDGKVFLPYYLKDVDEMRKLASEAISRFFMERKFIIPVEEDIDEIRKGTDCVIPGISFNEVYIHHIKRYIFASRFLRGKILDFSTGVGYGAKFLSRFFNVVGIEVSWKELNYAEKTYKSQNISFLLVDYISKEKKLPFRDGVFDGITFFEVIEHIGYENFEIVFEELGRIAKENAIFVISTPNKLIYEKFHDISHELTHISMLQYLEFKNFLEKNFESVQIFSQQRPSGLINIFEEFNIESIDEEKMDLRSENFVAVCRGRKVGKKFYFSSPRLDSILTFNWHEGFLYNFSKGFKFCLGTYKEVEDQKKAIYGEKTFWNEKIRPKPDVKILSDFKPEDFDIVIFHTFSDLRFLKFRVPKIFTCHNSVYGESFHPDRNIFYQNIQRNLNTMYYIFSNVEFIVFISHHKAKSWNFENLGLVIENGVDLKDFYNWNPSRDEVLICGNNLLRPLFNFNLIREILETGRCFVVGYNPFSRPADSFEELKKFYSDSYAYFSANLYPFEDGWNLSLLEAAATGMPLIVYENPTNPFQNSSIVIRSKDDFLKSLEKLKNLDFAKSLGENAREIVKERFSIEKFLSKWEEAIKLAIQKYKIKSWLFSKKEEEEDGRKKFGRVEERRGSDERDGNEWDKESEIRESERNKGKKKKIGRVVFVSEFLFPPVGGAEHTLLQYMKILKEKFEIIGICKGFNRGEYHPEREFYKDGVKMKILENENEIFKSLDNFSPDIVFTQLNWAPLAVEWAVKKGRERIVHIPSYEGICYEPWRITGTLGAQKCGMMCESCDVYKRHLKKHEDFKFALKNSKVIAISNFVKMVVFKTTGILPTIIYQPIGREYIGIESNMKVVDENKKYITLITGTRIKGADIFLELSKIFPDENFLIVGRGDIVYSKNLRVLANLDPRDIWGITKLLLVPSQWPEPFGRVIPEAILSGVPVLASFVGGIPEAVPTPLCLIEDFSNYEAWAKAIEEKRYEEVLSQKREAEKFLTENIAPQIKKFFGI